jgi:heme O synthase-like polyprenyltransferase
MNLTSAVIIHVVVPIVGIGLFRWLKTQMHQHQQIVLSDIELALVLISYGGWVMVLLTTFFWYWSGAASLGLFYLVFIAPIIMLYLAWRLFRRRNQSNLHAGYFVACAGYFLLPVSALIIRTKILGQN